MSYALHTYTVTGDDTALWSLLAHGAGHTDDQVHETEQVLRAALGTYGTAAERWEFRQQLHPVARQGSDPAVAAGLDPQWWHDTFSGVRTHHTGPDELRYSCNGPVAYGTDVARLLTERYEVTVVHARAVQCTCDTEPGQVHQGCFGNQVMMKVGARMEAVTWRSQRTWRAGEVVDQQVQRLVTGMQRRNPQWETVHWLDKPAFVPV